MKKINLIFLFFLIFLSHCGFKPIYSTSNINFAINEIEYEKNSLNQVIVSKLNFLKDSEKNNRKYKIKIDSKDKINTIAKNSKGDPTLFRMEINSNLKIFDGNQNILNKNYSVSFDYANKSKKFELKQYENQIKNDLLNQISTNIIRDLYKIK